MKSASSKTSSEDSAGPLPSDALIGVRRRWYNRKKGKVRLEDLSGFHWAPAGRGRYGRAAENWFLHAYMLCTKIAEGAVGHSCQHGPPPHCIRVCMTRKDNREIFESLGSLARPSSLRAATKSKNRAEKRRAGRKSRKSIAISNI